MSELSLEAEVGWLNTGNPLFVPGVTKDHLVKMCVCLRHALSTNGVCCLLEEPGPQLSKA